MNNWDKLEILEWLTVHVSLKYCIGVTLSPSDECVYIYLVQVWNVSLSKPGKYLVTQRTQIL